MKILLSILMLMALMSPVRAQRAEVVTEVLFSLTGESYTSRDFAVFRAVLKEVFNRDHLSEFSGAAFQDFVLSRLAYREARAFDMKAEKTTLTESMKKKLSTFSAAEIENEAEVIARSLQWIELKESQFKQRERFDVWLEVLKRKYQFRIKSAGQQ